MQVRLFLDSEKRSR